MESIVAYNIPHDMLPKNSNTLLPGINNAGIYFMFGKYDNKAENHKSEFVYVGKANKSNGVLSRVRQRHKFEVVKNDDKELYWNNVVIFVKTSTDPDSQLTEDMTGYLEKHFYLDIVKANKFNCINNVKPSSSISEDANLDVLMQSIKKVLYIIGYRPFGRELSSNTNDQNEKILYLM